MIYPKSIENRSQLEVRVGWRETALGQNEGGFVHKTGFDKWGSMDCTLGSATQSGASQRDNTILISHL